MLGGASSGAEEDPLASEELSHAGGQALGRLEVTSDSEEASEVPEWLKEGEYVVVGTSKTGIVRYIGPTDFQEGTWIGVELDLPSGEWPVGALAERAPGMCPVTSVTLFKPPTLHKPMLTCLRSPKHQRPKGHRKPL